MWLMVVGSDPAIKRVKLVMLHVYDTIGCALHLQEHSAENWSLGHNECEHTRCAPTPDEKLD